MFVQLSCFIYCLLQFVLYSKRQSCEETPKLWKTWKLLLLRNYTQFLTNTFQVQKFFKSIKNRLILTKINRGGFTRY